MDDNHSNYLKDQRSQSTCSPMGLSPLNLNRDHRHRSSLPNALLVPGYQILSPSNGQESPSPSSTSSPSPSSSIRDGLNRTSVISYSGTHGLSSSSPLSSFHQSTVKFLPVSSPSPSFNSSSSSSLQRPVSSSSLMGNSPINEQLLNRRGPISTLGIGFGRRHSVNVVSSEISNDVEMPETGEIRALTQLSSGIGPNTISNSRRSPSVDLGKFKSVQSTRNNDNLSQASLLLSLANSNHLYQTAIKQFTDCEDVGSDQKTLNMQIKSISANDQPSKTDKSENINQKSVISPSTSIESEMDSVMDDEMESLRVSILNSNVTNNSNFSHSTSVQSVSSFASRKKRGSLNESGLAVSNLQSNNISNDQLPSRSLQDLRSNAASSASFASSASDESNTSDFASPSTPRRQDSGESNSTNSNQAVVPNTNQIQSINANITSSETILSSDFPGIGLNPSFSRQQLLSSPCPICGDRISGFHYGLFSCESCKGFFKRTVQNKKNYVCLRGANCPISINTRKKCPACRFEKCLRMGMKLEAIREDRTRGGRSTYQCTYTLSPTTMNPGYGFVNSNLNQVLHTDHPIGIHQVNQPGNISNQKSGSYNHDPGGGTYYPTKWISKSDGSKPINSDSPVNFKIARNDGGNVENVKLMPSESATSSASSPAIPPKISGMLKEILDAEHLWHRTQNENKTINSADQISHSNEENGAHKEDIENDFCNIADRHLYKLVKWCKSLPLFQEISIDDRVALLHNSWVELLLLSCCYRSISTQGSIKISSDRSVSVEEARSLGINNVIERMINLADHLRRLHVDECEYVCLKVIILMTSDASGLQEVDKVDKLQKQIVEALQTYTSANYPQYPSKFGELLLRLPELERVCQVARETLAVKQAEKDVTAFNVLMELFRDDY
ncbi:nuclear hormone receptor FTZ-F1 beta isoform X1 [Tetranychus urticae]|uniref:nuclear hormone receptor FTZ-F1 beta isoform X1 n=1 Tax=Tetranychus urticae TaxID=32264 RepID=UPI00077BFA3C|nr:nuclear hormone receptor FTZ-F1 beta isoform X1 [Tetranychus urticae]